MFPSFTSLADRERKRIDLLDRAKLRVKQNETKRAMYAETAWASDANSTISLAKRSTQDTCVQAGDGDLKNSEVDAKIPVAADTATGSQTNSQEIPEVKRPLRGSNEVRRGFAPRTSSPGRQPSPGGVEDPRQTPSVDIHNEVMSGAQSPLPQSEKEGTPENKPDKTEEFIAKRWIQNLYKSNPNWIALRFNPIKTNTTRDMKRYIGKNGKLYTVSTGKPSKSKYIDWVLTAEELMNIRSDGESNSIDEVSLMRMEDANIPYQNITGNKRRDEFPNQTMGKVHIRPTWFHDSSSSTTADEKQAKSKILFMLKAYKKKLIGSNIVIRPVLKDGEVLNKYELIIDSKGDLNIRNQETKRNKQSRLSEISWLSTLALFSETVKSRGLTFEFEPSPDTGLDSDPNRFKPTQGIWYKGKLSGPDVMEDLSIPETEAKTIISDYFIEAGKSDSIFPIHLLPLTIGKATRKYYFSAIDGNLRVRNKDVKKHPALSGEAHTGFFKRIQWAATLDLLIKYIDEMEAFLNSDRDVDKATKEPIMSALTLYMYVLKAHGVKIKEPTVGGNGRSPRSPDSRAEPREPWLSLKGRGLLGAGMKTLEGVSRNKGQTYNLNDIQGLATPSAYIYRKLGSKFIRLPDLDKRTLTIVQPNRRKVGPMHEISDPLQALIKDLVYKNSIEQQQYDKLSTDDKKIFKEIFEMTHLQYNFAEQLEDPLDSLRMEYDKLKGELMLGNDNPSILKQLKVVCVDMYSNKLISDSEFKSIITRLL